MSDMSELQKAVESLTGEVNKKTDKARELAEEALGKTAAGEKLTLEMKTNIDELLKSKNEMAAELAEMQQKQARRPGADENANQHKTAGELFVASTEFQNAKADGRLSRKGANISVEMKQVTTLDASAGQLLTPNVQNGMIMTPQRRMTIRQLLAPGRTDKPSIQYFRELLFTNNAAPVVEGTRKPESDITFEDALARVIKIAHFIKATTEAMDDIPQLQSIIDQRLRYGLAYAEEQQLLNGSGVGNNLLGLFTQATPYAAPFAVAAETPLDRLRLAMLQAEMALLPATGHVMSAWGWARIELAKDANANYVIGNAQGQIQPTLWGLPVVTSMAMANDSFMTGNFRDSAQIFDREQANVTISTENESDFVENKITILAEERLALIVTRPQAIIKGTFPTVAA